MKKVLSSLIVIFAFIGFWVSDYLRRNEIRVLKIISPDMFVADINKNGKEDIDETICVAGVKSYKFDINDTDNIGFWYLANQFALKNIQDKSVKLTLTGEKTEKCKSANVTVNGRDYGELLTNNNFNLNNIDELKLEEQKRIIEKLNLVIYNHHSRKYHKLDCKFGKLSHDAVILPMKQILKEGKKCKYCLQEGSEKPLVHKHQSKTSSETFMTEIKLKYYPHSVYDGNFKLILSDHTNKLKPDKNCSMEMCKDFVSLINSAKTTIDIASYGFDNIPEVHNALIEAYNRGVKIRVVYDVRANGENSVYPDTKDFLSFLPLSQLRNDLGKNKGSANIIMHNKFAIFDKKSVFTGSMNFSATGFSGFNSNTVLIMNSVNAAKIYEKEFNRMFDGNFHNQKKTLTENVTSEYAIYFSPQDKIITRKIIPLINDAQKYIYVPIFVITHEELSQALVNAHLRGINVKLIVDATNSKIPRSKVDFLRKGGVPVKVENYAGKMHSKSIIIDDKYLIIGSMNFSKSGENKNDENCVILENPKLARFYKGYFEYIWSKIPDKYLNRHLKAESKDSIGSCNDGVDNDFNGLTDSSDAACK